MSSAEVLVESGGFTVEELYDLQGRPSDMKQKDHGITFEQRKLLKAKFFGGSNAESAIKRSIDYLLKDLWCSSKTPSIRE